MKKITSFYCFCLLSCVLSAQGVGIGTTAPDELLHVKDGNIKLEGANKYLDFHTPSPDESGLRFFSGGLQNGGGVLFVGRTYGEPFQGRFYRWFDIRPDKQQNVPGQGFRAYNE